MGTITRHPSKNFEPRRDGKTARFLILHYTEWDFAASHARFMNNDPDQPGGRASPHYMVDLDGAVHQYVDESMRAWHAGKSYWGGEEDINSASIGIEMVNGGEPAGYPPYPDIQIAAVIELCRDILARHPSIVPAHVLGHSDVAPGRKLDPGPNFPWGKLAAAGVALPRPSV